MRFFNKPRKPNGRLAVALKETGAVCVRVARAGNAKPRVMGAIQLADTPMSEALDKLARDMEGLWPCSAVLPPSDYQLLSMDAPPVPREELKAAIRWRLKDMLDFHVDDAAIDVLDVPSERDASNRARTMFVVAARNQIIAARHQLFEKSRLQLDVIDIPEMAQRNIAALFEAEGRGLGLLYFDESGGLLTITQSGELQLSRRIDVPLRQLQTNDDDEFANALERVTVEVQRSLDHFDRHARHILVSRVLLAPVPSVTNRLQTYLASNLYLPVELLKLDEVLDIQDAPELQTEEGQQQFFLATGAALRHEETVL